MKEQAGKTPGHFIDGTMERKTDELLHRVTFDKDILGGKPVIRGLRISVEMILELLARGATSQEILEDYPELEPEDLQAALTYAHRLVAADAVVDRVPA